jgi:hypothetical protein
VGVVNITNLAVVVKRSPRRLLAWVTDFATGAPVAGARVRLFDHENGQPLKVSGTTRTDGTCVLVAGPDVTETVLVEQRGGRARTDVAGVPVGVENPDGRLKMHFRRTGPCTGPARRFFGRRFCGGRAAVATCPSPAPPRASRCATPRTTCWTRGASRPRRWVR